MKKIILLAAFVTGFSLISMAGNGIENGTVHGTIIDSDTKKPIANTTFHAAIFKASYLKEFQTDANGNFKIIVPTGEHTLIIDKMGYRAVKKESIIIKDGSIIRINYELRESEEELHHPFMTPITLHSF
jgi:hypothetical protein